MEQDKKQNVRSIGDNSFAHGAKYDGMLEQAVRFLDRLNNLVRYAKYEVSRAINGKNAVVRAVGVRDADSYLQKLIKETESWDVVINNMKKGKDIHIQENCKSEKLDIVGGAEYNFGQYLVNQSSDKFCKENTDGRKYIEKVNDQ